MTGAARRAGRTEEGAATVLVVVMAGILCFVTVGLGAASGLVVAQRRAQAAADLASLAAAAALSDRGRGCDAAASSAERNRARLVSCEVDGQEATVTVVVPGPRWPGRRVEVTAQARAGPATGAAP